MKLLVHTCCAPCAIEAVDRSKKDGFKVTGFFYNPNIHPESEYNKRKDESLKYFDSEGLELIEGDYESQSFFTKVKENQIPPKRCLICWEMRLNKTSTFAKEKGFDSFTTTLLGSPYQNHKALKGICERLSDEKKIKFYYKDFREGFKKAHNLAREKGIYCQKYCGCVFSMVEREEERRKKKEKCSI